jgi:hypothetical protein
MERFSFDLLVYVLLFAGILLFNYVRRRLARRSRRAPLPPAPETAPPPAIAWGRMSETEVEPEMRRDPASRTTPLPMAAPPQVGRRRAQPLFRSRAEVRRAIIGMTVLGPCRAQDPPDAP